MKRKIVTLSSKGQLTIPAEFRKGLSLEKGQAIFIMRVDHELILKPMRKLSKLYGVDKELLAGEDLDKWITDLREKWDKEFERRLA